MKSGVWSKIAYALGGLLALVGLAIAYVVFVRLGYIEPEEYRSFESSEVKTSVDVYRDSYGVPHIFANELDDVFFGVGYTMAEDRLTQLELIIRTARGRLSEILGPKSVAYDEWSRQRAYTDEQLNEMIAGMPDEGRTAFLSMVNGINHYVREANGNPDEKMPVEFGFLGMELKPYRPEDVLAGITMLLRKFGSSGGTELTNQAFLQAMVEQHGQKTAHIIFNDILPLVDPDAYPIADSIHSNDKVFSPLTYESTSSTGTQDRLKLSSAALDEVKTLAKQTLASLDVISQYGASLSASRTIVVGAERSATGNPLILQGTADGIELHIKTPQLEFAGLSVPPMGIPLQGRNHNLGAVITTGERDTIDIFAVDTDPDNPNRYLYQGQWHEMSVRTETIKVKGGESVEIDIASTVHGNVILRDKELNKAYSRRWAMWMDEANTWAQALNAIKANSAKEIATVLAKEFATNTNMSYADKYGNIGFRHTGNLPVRAPSVDPRLPAKGDGSEDWLGMHAHETNPSSHNPQKGYLHAWNNNPEPGTVYGDGARWGKHFRTHLPLELINSKEKISIEDLKSFNKTLSASFYSVDLALTSPKYFVSYLQEAAVYADNERITEVVRVMSNWNGLFEDADNDGYYDHSGAIVFRRWLPLALDTVFSDDVDDWWQKLDAEKYIPYQTSLLLRALEGEAAGKPMKYDYFNGEERAALMAKSLSRVIDELNEHYKTDNPAEWQEPVYWRYMAREDMRGGDKPTYNRKRATRYTGGAVKLRYLPKTFKDNGAPEWLSIMEITPEKPYYLSVIPTGGQSWFINSNWKASAHINDQQQLHETLQFKKVHLDKETIVSDRESHLEIKPIN